MIRNIINPDKDICGVCGSDIDRIYNSYPIGQTDVCLNKNCGFVTTGLTNQFLVYEKHKEYIESRKPVEY